MHIWHICKLQHQGRRRDSRKNLVSDKVWGNSLQIFQGESLVAVVVVMVVVVGYRGGDGGGGSGSGGSGDGGGVTCDGVGRHCPVGCVGYGVVEEGGRGCPQEA